MKVLLIFLISSVCLSFQTYSRNIEQLKVALPEYSKVYDEKRDPFKDATAAIALAQATKRNILIEIGGNWCSWCHKMDAFLEKNPDIYQGLHRNFVLLKINVSDTNENEKFMKSLPPVLGYPHMYISTDTGKMMLSKDTAELLEGDNYSRTAWLSFLEQWRLDKNSENLQKLNTSS
ncbi:thioredoxin family protein [Thalassotalea profundi]|uniref:Thioredoxin family protein n=1 Tax=Thalassotalea profundi TaxID=2036687 RepID=A0ABQ3IWC5_9GAMM|nr:thioredoxin family protein [Thalassotalea profundi]GHE96806.1 thioredoxin family protein [Thalassotalea profundi]